MSIFLPKKINVGFQNRNDTYTNKLAYVTYFDEKDKLRKEPSWNGWRDKEIPNEIYTNEPTEGFVLNKKVGGDRYSWNPRQTYTRVYDPRGFEFEITIPNLLWILENCNCIKGKGLEGEFVYGWDRGELLLIPTESPDYIKIKEGSETIHNNTFIKAKDLIIGLTYEDLNGEQYVYMGKSKPWYTKKNYFYSSYNYDYKYPLDNSWKVNIIESYISSNSYSYSKNHLTYYKDIQSDKNEFFFVKIGETNSIVHMESITKKFKNVVSDTKESFTNMLDLLYSNPTYIPNDYDAYKILELPFERFVLFCNKAINKSLEYDRDAVIWFEVGVLTEDKLLDKISIHYYKAFKQFSVHVAFAKDNGIELKRFNESNLKELYEYIHPMYGEKYLKNGYLSERYFYDTWF